MTTAAALPSDRLEGSYKPLPLWASIPLLIVCLFGGGWIAHWYMNSGALVKETSILGLVPPDGRARGLVESRGDKDPKAAVTNWQGHTELAEADFKVDKGTPSVTRLEYHENGNNNRGRYFQQFPDPMKQTFEGAYMATQEGINKVRLPAEKSTAIRALLPRAGETQIIPTDGNKAKLLSDFGTYLSAKDAGKVLAEIQVLATLDEIAKADAEDRCEKLKKLFTPEELAALPALATQANQGGQGRGPGGGGGGRGRRQPPAK
jgi:hypothetical protein